MAFTYDDDMPTNRDSVRFSLGDTVAERGPRPDGRNFNDAEIAHLLSSEGDVVNAAIAFGFETLRDEWAAFALLEQEGDVRFDARQVSDQFDKSAMQWRKKSDTVIEKSAKFRVHNVAC